MALGEYLMAFFSNEISRGIGKVCVGKVVN